MIPSPDMNRGPRARAVIGISKPSGSCNPRMGNRGGTAVCTVRPKCSPWLPLREPADARGEEDGPLPGTSRSATCPVGRASALLGDGFGDGREDALAAGLAGLAVGLLASGASRRRKLQPISPSRLTGCASIRIPPPCTPAPKRHPVRLYQPACPYGPSPAGRTSMQDAAMRSLTSTVRRASMDIPTSI